MTGSDALKIDKTSDVPLYVQVERSLRRHILKDNLKPGTFLPSAVEISKTFSVNHQTVRKAIKSLVDQNVLNVVSTRGAFVTEDARLRRVLWVTGIDQSNGDLSSYYNNMLRLAAKEAEKRQIRLEPVWLTAYRPEEIKSFIRRTQLSNYAGAIFHDCGPGHHLLHEVANAGLPYVCLRPVGAARPFTVSLDNFGGATLAMEHLRARGHKEVLIVRHPDLPLGTDLDKYRGYLEKAACQADLKPISRLLPCERNNIAQIIRDADQAIKDFINQHHKVPSAIYFSDDVVARGGCLQLIAYCAARGISDLDIVVRWGLSEIVPLGLPVTYLAKDTLVEAREAIDLLDEQLDGRFPGNPHRVIPYQIVLPDQVMLSPDR